MSSNTTITLPTQIRGDTWTIDRQFVDGDGKPIDISLYAIFLTIKESPEDSDAEAIIQAPASIIDGPNGLFQIVVGTSDTELVDPETYYYDIQLESPTFVVTTMELGRVRVAADITLETDGSVSPSKNLIGGTLHTIAPDCIMTVPGDRSYIIDDLEIESGGQFVLEPGARLVLVGVQTP